MIELKLADVVSVVSLVAGFTSKLDLVPALTHLFGGDGLLRACSGEAGAVWKAPWATETMVVPDKLVKVLTSLSNQGHETVELSVGKERLTIKGKGFRGQLPLLTSEVDASVKEQLERKAPKGGVAITPAFWSDIAKVEPVVSKDATKPALTGVYWSPEGFFVASDNFRISACYPAEPIKCPEETGLLIPDYLLQLLTSHRTQLAKGLREDNHIWFTGKEGAIYGSLIQGEFPAAGVWGFLAKTRKMTGEEGATVELKTTGSVIEQIIDRLLLFSSDMTTFKIKVEILKDSARLSVEEEGGAGSAAQETIPAKVEGEEVEPFYVNAKMFRDAMYIAPKFWHKAGCPLYILSVNEDRKLEHLVTLLAA